MPPRDTSAIRPSSATLDRVTMRASRPRVATTATTSSTTRPSVRGVGGPGGERDEDGRDEGALQHGAILVLPTLPGDNQR